MSQTENPVVPLAPTDKGNGGDQLDQAGQSILNLLHKAAGVAEKNSQHALDMAQKLSHQLVAAEQRITDLEAEVEGQRDRGNAQSSGFTRSIRKSKTASSRVAVHEQWDGNAPPASRNA